MAVRLESLAIMRIDLRMNRLVYLPNLPLEILVLV